MRQLNTLEQFFLYADQRGSGMHGTMMQVFNAGKNPDIAERYEKLRRRIEKAVPGVPLLHEKILRLPAEADKPYWVRQDDVDVDFHMHRIALPPPGNWQQLQDVYGQICATPMDLECPLWEVHVIEGLNDMDSLNPDSFAVITKMHHAGADGVTATKVTAIIAGAPIPDAKPGDETSLELSRVLSTGISNYINTYVQFSKVMLEGASTMSAWAIKRFRDGLLRQSLESSNKKITVPATRFNESVSPDRTFSTFRIPLEALSALRKELGYATVNDLVLAICGGGLREYLLHHDELPDQSLVAFMPVSTRDGQDGGNQFSGTRVVLHTDIEPPLERVRLIHEATKQSKEEAKSTGAKRLDELGNIVPAALLSLILGNAMRYSVASKVPPIANCVITNVAGPTNEIRLDDSALTFVNGSPPITDGLGLIFGTLSYNGDLIFATSSCKKMLPEREFMTSCLESAFLALSSSVKKKPARKTRTKKGGRKAGPKKAIKK